MFVEPKVQACSPSPTEKTVCVAAEEGCVSCQVNKRGKTYVEELKRGEGAQKFTEKTS